MKILNTDQNLALSMMRQLFIEEDTSRQLHAVRTSFEKGLIRTLFNNMDISQQKDFIARYNNQLAADQKTLDRWHGTQEAEQSGKETKNSTHAEAVVKDDGTMIIPFVDDGLDDERKRKRPFNILQ